MEITIAVLRQPHSEGLPLPSYATPDSAGCDLLAAVTEDLVLPPMGRALIPTGLCIALCNHYEAQVRPRSGLAAKHGVTILNSPGTIDADYRGEVKVLLVNLGDTDFTITRGMRIAQLVVAPVTRVQWEEAEALPPSLRGDGGFGSTGI